MYKMSAKDSQAFQKAFNEKTKTSKRLAEAHRKKLADSRATAGIRPSTKEMVYRIFGKKGEGAFIYDIDNNRYVDVSMGFGVLLCGHYPEFITRAITEQLRQGFQLGPETPLVGDVVDLIREMTGTERVAFYNTGTEAVMMAVRLARGRRQGRKVVTFENSYHGHYDDVAPMNNMFTPERTLVLEYGADASLEKIKAHASDIAAVIAEPVQSANLDLQPKAFLQQLRKVTEENDIALIFDEVLNGFRIHQGGAQAVFDVQADIVTYGKIVGGGLPIGVVAGKAYYLDQVDGGPWQFGDASLPLEDRVMSVGTFSKNPLVMAASRAILSHLKEMGPGLQENLNARAQAFFKDINNFFGREGYPIKIRSFGSQFRFYSNRNMDPFIYRLINKGVYIWENRNLYFSTAHRDEDYAFVKQCIEESAKEVYWGPKSVKSTTVTAGSRIEEDL